METSINEVIENEQFPLIKNKKFMFVLFSSVFTSLAFSSYMMSESWYVVNQLGLGAFLGIVMMMTAIPRLLFMLIGGVLADRYSHTKIMIVSGLLRILLLIGMIAMFAADLLNIWALMLFALFFGILDAYFWPANAAIVPTIVDKENLTRANGFMRTAYHTSMIVGPMIAAYLIATISYGGVFATVAILLSISSLLIYFIKDESKKPPSHKNSILTDLKEGITYITSTRTILTFLIVFIVFNFFFIGPVGIASPLIVNDILHGNALILAYIDSGWAAGLLSGSILTIILNLRKRRGFLLMSLLFLEGLLTLLFGQVSFVWGSIAIVYLMGICTSMVNIPMYSFVQEKTDQNKLGRVMGLFTMVSNGLVPLSLALVSMVISFGIQIASMLLVCGIVLMLFCAAILWRVKGIRMAD